MSMFVALVRTAVRKEFIDVYEKRIVAQSAIMKGEIKGLVKFQILRPLTEGAPYVNFTIWKSRDDMLKFQKSNLSQQNPKQSQDDLPERAFLWMPTTDEYETIEL